VHLKGCQTIWQRDVLCQLQIHIYSLAIRHNLLPSFGRSPIRVAIFAATMEQFRLKEGGVWVVVTTNRLLIGRSPPFCLCQCLHIISAQFALMQYCPCPATHFPLVHGRVKCRKCQNLNIESDVGAVGKTRKNPPHIAGVALSG